MNPENQRQNQRVDRRIIARYRTTIVPEASWLMSPLLDLSNGGAKFLSEYVFEVGEPVEVQLLLPSAPEPIPLTGKVAWARPGLERLTELGVTFRAPEPAVQQALASAVAYFLQRAADA